ncbi:MAG: hypothetical protein R3A10_12985 [Caldilineaceae bacterium]
MTLTSPSVACFEDDRPCLVAWGGVSGGTGHIWQVAVERRAAGRTDRGRTLERRDDWPSRRRWSPATVPAS